MNVTFFLGNGFDLNCGLRSSYNDVIKKYIQHSATDRVLENPAVERFKRKIEEDISKDSKLWSDFECGMAEELPKFNSERDFIACVQDFKVYLNEYLIKEQRRIDTIISGSPELSRQVEEEIASSVVSFYEGISRNVTRSIEQKLTQSAIVYNFLSFNYTTFAEKHISKVFKERPSQVEKKLYKMMNQIPPNGDVAQLGALQHIHDVLEENQNEYCKLILGMDNESQLNQPRYQISNILRRAFLKPYYNKINDNEKMQRVKELIDSSSAICAFGASFGESDLMWKEKILEWLNRDADNHLFFYMYDYSVLKRSPEKSEDWKMEQEEEGKKKWAKQFGIDLDSSEMQRVERQVHIPIGKNIFNVKKLIEQHALMQSCQKEREQLSATLPLTTE